MYVNIHKTKITYYTEYTPQIYWLGQFNYAKHTMSLTIVYIYV